MFGPAAIRMSLLSGKDGRGQTMMVKVSFLFLLEGFFSCRLNVSRCGLLNLSVIHLGSACPDLPSHQKFTE